MRKPQFLNRFALLAVCGLLSLSGCHFSFAQARYRATRNFTVPHSPSTPIHINTLNGGITVRRGNVTEANICATIACISQERLANTRVIAEQRDGTLVVEAAFPGGRLENNESCSFEITVPGAAGVQLQTHNGSLSMSGLAGTASLHTSNGDITVDAHNGPLQAQTSNGRVNINAATGRVDVSGANGSVSARLSAENPGPATLHTSNGDVKLHVGPAFTGRVNFSTSIGSLHVGQFANAKETLVKDKSGHVVIGEGAGVSELRTSIGGVELIGPQR